MTPTFEQALADAISLADPISLHDVVQVILASDEMKAIQRGLVFLSGTNFTNLPPCVQEWALEGRDE